MGDPAKRNAVMDWLFGAPLTGDDLAKHLAGRPPRRVRYVQLALILLVLVLLTAGFVGLKDRLPLVGPWLTRDWLSLIALGCLATNSAVNWYYRRRADIALKP